MLEITRNDYKIAQKYLSRFGAPLTYILKTKHEDGGAAGKEIARKFNSKNYPLKDVLTINRNYPLQVSFTPNGNFQDNNLVTGKLLSRGVGFEGHKPYWNAMVADFDKKDSKEYKDKSLDEYLDYILNDIIDIETTPLPTYIQKSVGGFHLIWIISEKERVTISKFMNDREIADAMFFMQSQALGQTGSLDKKSQEQITGVDLGRQRFLTSTSIRLPGSYHRKTGKPVLIKLFQVYKKSGMIELKEIRNAEDINIEAELNQITFDMLKLWLSKYNEMNKIERDFKKIIIKNTSFDKDVISWVDETPVPIILEKLTNYSMVYGGREYGLKYNEYSKSISIIYNDGTSHMPSGYKYRPIGNMIVEFNGSKSVDERPWGKPTRFLYYFFGRNWKLVDEFLMKEFDRKLISGKDEELGVLWHASVGDNDIVCLPKKIILKKLVTTASGSVNPKTTDLFHQPFTVIGKGYTSMSTTQGEAEDVEQVFIIKKFNDDKQYLLKCYPTKRLWNKANIAHGLFFYGEDNDLGLLYDAIFRNTEIPEYDIVSRNGYYKGYYAFGGKIFETEEHNPIFNVINTSGFGFKIKEGKDISIKKYAEMGCKVWDERMFLPALLQSIALAGTDIWARIKSFNQFPGLLLTGQTGSGKTVLHETLSMALGYQKKERTMSISRTSPQPLKQAGIDGSILHLEEFTDPIKPASEDILRDILNRSMSSRGMPSMNIVWKYRSTPFVDGESMPASESVANRFVIIPVDQRYWKGNVDSIVKIQQYSIMQSVYPRRYELGKDPEKLGESFNKRVKYLISKNINPRSANVWATIFMVNELFEIDFDIDVLTNYAVALMKDVGINEGTIKSRTSFMELQILLAESVMQRKVTITETRFDSYCVMNFIFQKDYITKHISTISKIVNSINEKTLQYFLDNKIDISTFKPLRFDNPVLVLNIQNTEASPTDKALDDLKSKYIIRLPKSVYIFYDGDEEKFKF